MPAVGRSDGRLFTVGGDTVMGERLALPVASQGIGADGVLGASDCASPVLAGTIELIHENVEWLPLSKAPGV